MSDLLAVFARPFESLGHHFAKAGAFRVAGSLARGHMAQGAREQGQGADVAINLIGALHCPIAVQVKFHLGLGGRTEGLGDLLQRTPGPLA